MSYIFTGRNYNFEDHKNKRKLEERSHLTLEFPQSNDRIFRTYIPFLENPQISEAGSNSLQEYNLMGRAGSLFAYGGSESRAFDITFHISLLHLLHINSTEGIADKFHRHFNLFFADKESAKARFDLRRSVTDKSNEEYAAGLNAAQGMAGPTMTGHSLETQMELDAVDQLYGNEGRVKGAQDADLGSANTSFNPEGFPHAQTHRAFYSKWIRKITGGKNFAESFISGLGFGEEEGTTADLDKIVNLVYVWINLVRATCLNNATNTVQGPPIVRLTHGPMYNNIPCVVRDYSISIVDEVGYDIQTLTPKKLEITMTLSEMRTGDFGGFQEGWLESGDNLAGWEAIIGNNNTDPYNGDITREGIQIGQAGERVATLGDIREGGRSFAD
tara:strand:- start:750 stop:1910 length:1161 start_codon:yes stop_codon:yes gene_type:complete